MCACIHVCMYVRVCGCVYVSEQGREKTYVDKDSLREISK